MDFLDFEEDGEQNSQDEGVASIEDDEGIEGYVIYVDVARPSAHMS